MIPIVLTKSPQPRPNTGRLLQTWVMVLHFLVAFAVVFLVAILSPTGTISNPEYDLWEKELLPQVIRFLTWTLLICLVALPTIPLLMVILATMAALMVGIRSPKVASENTSTIVKNAPPKIVQSSPLPLRLSWDLYLHKIWFRWPLFGRLFSRRLTLLGKDLQGVNLSEADLQYSNLMGSNLTGSNLFRADLSGANLSGANLSGAVLVYAKLSCADLRGADLRGADLRGANLYGIHNPTMVWGLADAIEAIGGDAAGIGLTLTPPVTGYSSKDYDFRTEFFLDWLLEEHPTSYKALGSQCLADWANYRRLRGK